MPGQLFCYQLIKFSMHQRMQIRSKPNLSNRQFPLSRHQAVNQRCRTLLDRVRRFQTLNIPDHVLGALCIHTFACIVVETHLRTLEQVHKAISDAPCRMDENKDHDSPV